MKHMSRVVVLSVPLLLAACAPGYNSVLFVTRSNAGLDLDTNPPTTELAISRQETVLQPGFEGGQTLPVLASFYSEQNFASKFLFGVSSTFSTGDAAYNMAVLYNLKDDQIGSLGILTNTAGNNACASLSSVHLSTPVTNLPLGLEFQNAGTVKPVTFTTNTMFGLKIGWTNTSFAVPTSVKAGFNRKEVAFTSIAATPCNSSQTPAVNIPSLLATVDQGTITGTDTPDNSYLQYFATGKAATALSRQYGVRKAMLERLDPANEDSFDAAVAEQDARDFRLEGAQATARTVVARLTTAGQVYKAHTMLNAYPYYSASPPIRARQCPSPTAPSDAAASADDSAKELLLSCINSASNLNDAQIAAFEQIALQLNEEFPVPAAAEEPGE